MPRKPFADLTKEEKIARAERIERETTGVLEGASRSHDPKTRAGAQKARKAARRVQKRLKGEFRGNKIRNPSSGKKKKTKEKTPMEKSEPRRRKVEKGTGTSKFIDPLRKLENLAKAGQRKRGER